MNRQLTTKEFKEKIRAISALKATEKVWANRLAGALRERDYYKARAERIEEALTQIAALDIHDDLKEVADRSFKIAVGALAQWEESQK